MCLGIPGRILELPADQPDLGRVDVEGVVRGINMSLLADDPPVPGEWVLIHLGFALQKMTEAEVAEMRSTRELLGLGVGVATQPAIENDPTPVPIRETVS
ncbi:MAG: HypC/HybG/HupF family hydrogenase formation chaperone [Chloroflexota bacterium]